MRRGPSGDNSRRQYWLYVGFFALASLQLLATVLRPPLPTTNVSWQTGMLVFSLALFVGSFVMAMVGSGSGAVTILVFGGIALIALTTAKSAGGQGQLMAGAYLTLLGLIAGLTLTRRWLVAAVIAGSVLYLLATNLHALFDSRSYSVGMTVLFAAVSLVVQELVGRLRGQATRDPLTGALNRRGLEGDARIVRERDARAGKPTTVLEIDLDGFKGFNDTYGHAAGDDLLRDLVAAWLPVLRRSDLLGRVGGDEFVIVLSATTQDEALPLLNRLREANHSAWTAGMSSWGGSESLWDALQRADVAMYAHKPESPQH